MQLSGFGREIRPTEELGQIIDEHVTAQGGDSRGFVGSGRLEIVNDFDFFGCRRLPDGLEYTEHARDRFTIVRGDPLSAKVECDWVMNVGRGDWRTRVEASASMTSTATHFLVTNAVEAYEGDVRVFVQTRTRAIPRALV